MMRLTRRIVAFKVFILLKICLNDGVVEVNSERLQVLNIAIIGAGAAGLSTAKNSIEAGHNVTIYEQNEELGGVWVYTDNIGKTKYGLDVHTAMYKGTNAPLPIMEFPDHHYPNDTISFPPQSEVLAYLHSYADRFTLNRYIKLNHLVVHVRPIEHRKWEMIVRNLEKDQYIRRTYDAVFVCNGHFFVPNIPAISGADQYGGTLIHSHTFRTAHAFREIGKRVLIIGDGPSGLDLVNHLSRVADSVTISRRNWLNETKDAREKYQNRWPAKTAVRDIVKRLTTDGAEFIDGTKESFSVIVFATGYKYSYPFLSVDSGIHVEDNFIQPHYKHIINIDHPPMALIGVPKSFVNFPMFDLQARFVLKYLSKEKCLPSKPDMLKDQRHEAEKLWSQGYSRMKTHSVHQMQREYFNQLSTLADIKNVTNVLVTLALEGAKKRAESPTEFRKYKFTVIDENTYTRQKYDD